MTPKLNEDISSRDDVQRTVQSDVSKADKLDAAVQRYSSDEWNTESLRIVEGSPEIIFRKVFKQSDSSKRTNLANSLSVHTLELVLLRHTPMQTDNVGEQRSGGAATRIANQDGVWRPTLSDIKAVAIHGKSETIREKLAYRKFIKDSDFETREVFERENIKEHGNIKNIETRLRMTQLDDKRMENIEECKNIKNISTRLRMTRSENSSTRSKKHRPKVNLDPDPSLLDSSDSSSSDSAPTSEVTRSEERHFRCL